VSDSFSDWLNRLERWGTVAENAVVVLLLTAMMLLAVGQILLRIFFSIGFVWADELISLIVLWIAIVASVAAARSDRHLRIDALSHFVPQKYARYPRIVVDAFAAGMCLILGWHSYRYILLIREFEDTVLSNVPAWVAFGVVPIAFALMAYRFLLLSGKGLLRVRSGDDEAAVSRS
jgi:TRAP-type C4-dicarboxylate transport system permease small subunit